MRDTPVDRPGGFTPEPTEPFVYTAYADDNVGTGFSLNPSGKPFVGVLSNDNPSQSMIPSDYVWYQIFDLSEGDFEPNRKLKMWVIGSIAVILVIAALLFAS
jgi:hypothetical protein